MIIDVEDYLAHYGVLRKSGRYPWGSGEDPKQSGQDFLGAVEKLKAEGLTEVEIARGMGMNVTELRNTKSIVKNREKQEQIHFAQQLKDKGYSNVAIGERMGINESTVRSLLAPGQQAKLDVLNATSNMLKTQVEKKKYVDVGAGVEHHIGVSSTKMKTAIAKLKQEGYKVQYVKVEQLGTGKQTTLKVLTKADVPYAEVYRNRDQIKQIAEYSKDAGLNYTAIKPPTSVSSKRIAVRYAEDGGTDADGVIYLRRNVKDLSLGSSRYAQVRIAVDGSHYLKGMAMYKDDLPPGVDMVFNTNKKNTGNKLDAMKPMNTLPDGKIDLENPFGASVDRQSGALNILREEGSWDTWSRSLSSQTLSKQSPTLAKSQLNMTYDRRKAELDEISKLTNPAVRKKLLDEFAEGADSAAVHLKAAALPRSSWHVILPFNSIKENEIYAPNFNDGERVALIRYPHGGTFEIPELTVNNRFAAARKAIGSDAKDAVGIHAKVAERLSGADFDGDTVLVIPNNSRQIKTSPALKGLEDFDHQQKYRGYEGMSVMTDKQMGFEMGDISNLITDMTIRKAGSDELARAVRHSMVVIDAKKHKLNWRQSAVDNGIKQLKTKYQSKANAGASTLISKATSRLDVNERKQGFRVDPTTGRKIYTETGENWVRTTTTKSGAIKEEVVFKKQRSTKLAETDDAHTLSSGTVIEKVYADHSNRLKALANEARLESVNTKTVPYSPTAKVAYASQVTSLDLKLKEALRNAPLERQAQILANAVVAQKKAANPDMDAASLKKIKSQALIAMRIKTGAKKSRIDITDDEWTAIQAGAISNKKLTDIMNNSDMDRVRELATPRSSSTMSPSKVNRAKTMLASGYTQAEVAAALGVSVSTITKSISE